jgi:hypothetical protein
MRMRGKKTGGRQVGTPNKATAEIRALAQSFAPAALAELARLASEATSEAARVAACVHLLDRAYGKPSQPVTDDADRPLVVVIRELGKCTDENVS